MKLEAFLLCDAATDNHGKLNILGAFDNIFAFKVPAVHPACAIAARLRFTQAEQGEHMVRLTIMDADGKTVIPDLNTKLISKITEPADSIAINLVLNIQGLKLHCFGEYSIDLAIDGRQEGSLPLTLRQPRAPGQG